MTRIEVELRQRSLPERILLGIVALAVLVLGFFFLAAAVVVGLVVAAVVLLRLWWIGRRLRKAEEAQYVQAEYTVVEREPPPAAPRLPPDR